jgi:hypothetical protein
VCTVVEDENGRSEKALRVRFESAWRFGEGLWGWSGWEKRRERTTKAMALGMGKNPFMSLCVSANSGPEFTCLSQFETR